MRDVLRRPGHRAAASRNPALANARAFRLRPEGDAAACRGGGPGEGMPSPGRSTRYQWTRGRVSSAYRGSYSKKRTF